MLLALVAAPAAEAQAATKKPRRHLFGDGLAAGEATAGWTHATPFEGTDSFGVLHEIGIADDTKRVGFIVHGNGDTGACPRRRSGCGRAT